jgi:hypothetical protein
MKVIVNFNKKSPISGVEFSSVGAGISIESDLGDNKGDEDVKAMSRHLYVLAKGIVEQVLNNSNGNRNPNGNRGGNGISGGNFNGNGRGTQTQNGSRRNGAPASSKQLNYLLSLAKKNGGYKDFQEIIERRYGVSALESLSKSQASELIEEYKNKGGGNNGRG